jgi:pilus assembly protein CpaB
MSPKTIIPLALAMVLGLVAVFLARNYITGASASATTVEQRPVVVAIRPIDRGTSIEASMLKVAQYPADSAPPNSFTDIKELTGDNARVALRGFTANEPILAPKLAPVGSSAVMSMNLGAGMRAISVKSDEVVGVGGFLVPGDKVDVLLTRALESNGSTVVQSLAENVTVLGIDQIDETDKPTVAKAITLEVTAEQAQAISLAKAVGVITFALRQGSDDSTLAKKVLSSADLLPAPVKPVQVKAPEPKRTKAAPKKSDAPPSAAIVVTRGTTIASYSVNKE